MRIPLEQSKRVLGGVDERPVELEQLLSGAPRRTNKCAIPLMAFMNLVALFRRRANCCGNGRENWAQL